MFSVEIPQRDALLKTFIAFVNPYRLRV